MKTFNEFVNESYDIPSLIKKGEKILVKFEIYKGPPTYEVEAYNDSWNHEGQLTFSYLVGGDMMMTAKWNGKEFIT